MNFSPHKTTTRETWCIFEGAKHIANISVGHKRLTVNCTSCGATHFAIPRDFSPSNYERTAISEDDHCL